MVGSNAFLIHGCAYIKLDLKFIYVRWVFGIGYTSLAGYTIPYTVHLSVKQLYDAVWCIGSVRETIYRYARVNKMCI